MPSLASELNVTGCKSDDDDADVDASRNPG